MIKGRPYQTECVTSIYQYFESGAPGNPLCALPTGTGKSVVIALFIESVLRQYAGQRMMVLTHVKELIAQNYEKFKTLWPQAPAGIYSAGLNKKEHNFPITFAGIASVAKKAHLFGRVDLVLIDEAHLVSPSEATMYNVFLAALKLVNPCLRVIGFTATPWRLGHGKLTDDGIFTDICFDITGPEPFNRLIMEGYLSPLISKRMNTILDTDGVHMRGGEFIASELQVAVNRDEVTAAALREVLEAGHNRRHWLIFASGVEHAEAIQSMLSSMGVECACVHSKMSSKDRDQILLDFKAGKLRAVVNNNVLTTGFDHPGIDLIVVLRPTASSVLWVQMLGRGTRPCYAQGFDLDTVEGRLLAIQNGPKQNCLVLDFANNTRNLGPINDPVIPRKKGEKGGVAPIKLCGSCSTWNHASVRHCACCGSEFTFAVKLHQQSSNLDVVKQDLPVIEVFKVDHITYTEHKKHDRPPMMKVSYYCGLRFFEEYLCFEHEGFPQRKARIWWRERATGSAAPSTTAQALAYSQLLAAPTHIRVHTNKKYPEILAYCYDGSEFGVTAPTQVIPTTQLVVPQTKSKELEQVSDIAHETVHQDEEWDDIPF